MHQINILKSLIRHAPIGLIISMLLGFAVTFLLFFNYYAFFLLPNMDLNRYQCALIAFCAALMVELMRGSFALSGGYDYGRGEIESGRYGIAISGAITFYKVVESYHAVSSIGNDTFFWSLFLFFVSNILFVYVCEIRFIMTISKTIETDIKNEETARNFKNLDFLELSENERLNALKFAISTLTKNLNREPKLKELSEFLGTSETTTYKYKKLLR